MRLSTLWRSKHISNLTNIITNIVSSITYIIDAGLSVINTIGNKKVQQAINKELMQLQDVRDKITESNNINTDSLNRLNSALSHLTSMKYSIDPRVVSIIDEQTSKITKDVSNINKAMNDNSSLIDKGSTIVNTKPSSFEAAFVGGIDRSEDISKLKSQVKTVDPSSLGRDVNSDNENKMEVKFNNV